MASFAGQFPANTYTYLMQIPGALTSSLKTAQDGAGTSFPIQFSTTAVKVTGTFESVGNATLASLTLNGVAFSNSSFSGAFTCDSSYVATLATNGVTYAKMQQISSGKLLGSNSVSTANIAEVSIGTGLTLSGGTLSLTSPAVSSFGIQTFTGGSGTYTPTANMKFIRVRMCGDGGGGGGVSNAGAYGVAASGSSGGYLEFYMTAAQVGSSKSYSVGTGGNGASAGANNGTDGAGTTFADWTAVGGAGGTGVAGGAADMVTAGKSNAGTNTVGTGTLITNYAGTYSSDGMVYVTGNLAIQSAPGRCYPIYSGVDKLPVGHFKLGTTAYNGADAGTFAIGMGGEGGLTINSANNRSGGQGGGGIIIIEEFI